MEKEKRVTDWLVMRLTWRGICAIKNTPKIRSVFYTTYYNQGGKIMLPILFAFLAGGVVGILDKVFSISKFFERFHVWRFDASPLVYIIFWLLGWYIIGFDTQARWDVWKIIPSFLGFILVSFFWPYKWTRHSHE